MIKCFHKNEKKGGKGGGIRKLRRKGDWVASSLKVLFDQKTKKKKQEKKQKKTTEKARGGNKRTKSHSKNLLQLPSTHRRKHQNIRRSKTQNTTLSSSFPPTSLFWSPWFAPKSCRSSFFLCRWLQKRGMSQRGSPIRVQNISESEFFHTILADSYGPVFFSRLLSKFWMLT